MSLPLPPPPTPPAPSALLELKKKKRANYAPEYNLTGGHYEHDWLKVDLYGVSPIKF